MELRNPKDFWTGIIYILFGTGAFLVARDYPIGTALKMGPGYFPTILSILLALIGIVSLARSFIARGSPVGGFAVKGLAVVLGATVLFGLVLRGGGLIVALPLLVVASAAASSRFRWRQAFLLAAGLTLFCTLIFLKGLGLPIPIVGSWFGR